MLLPINLQIHPHLYASLARFFRMELVGGRHSFANDKWLWDTDTLPCVKIAVHKDSELTGWGDPRSRALLQLGLGMVRKYGVL